MRKFTLFLMSLFLAVGAMAQLPAGFFAGAEVTFTNIQKDGTTKFTLYINDNNELALSTSSAEELGGAAKFFCEKRANNKYSFYNREKELYMIWRGLSAGYNGDKGVLAEYNATYCDWTINAGTKIAETQTYYIVSKRSNGNNDGSLVVKKQQIAFDGWGNSQAYDNGYTNLYNIEVVNREYVADASAFENGKIYTFVTERGWMGAKGDSYNVVSTAKTSHNLTGSKEDANFQWAVYKSENGKYYLYNIGKEMFMGVQANNNTSIPFTEIPTCEKLAFKVSSNAAYPIMLSTNNAAVINHSTEHGDGCISWTGGWGTLNDPGSNHKVEIVGDLNNEVLAKIEGAIATNKIGYFRLKGNSGNYIDASSIYNNATAKVGQMSMKSNAACNLAGTIFYCDENGKFVNYATGTHIRVTREIGNIDNTDGNSWAIYKTTNEGQYKLLSNANNWLHDNSGNRADRCSAESNHANTTHSWTIEKVESLPVTITAAKYATFYAPVAVTVPAGVTAHTVTIDGERAVLSEALTIIPAYTGVILYSETAATYTFAITNEEVDAIENNALLGTVATTQIAGGSTTYYLLANGTNGIGLYPHGTEHGNFQNNSHKAYLPVTGTQGALSYGFTFGGTTAIEGIEATAGEKAIYDLTGRKIDAITVPGIYIINGIKTIVE